MLRVLSGLLVVLGAAASCGAAQQPPGWISRPTYEHLVRHYPRQAAREGMEGFARIRCRIQVDGRLAACVVLQESPAGAGFGEATVELARYFQTAAEINGQSVEGGSIELPITWRMDE